MLEPEFKASGYCVSLGMCALRIVGQVLNGAFDGRGELAQSVEYRVHDFGQHMPHTHGNAARGDLPVSDALGGMGTIAADGGGAQRRPDEAFGEVRVAGRKGFEVSERFPFFEQQFNLPAQAITVTEVLEIKLSAREIGDEVARVVLTGIGIAEETAVERPVFGLETDVKVDRAAAGDFVLDVLEALILPTLDFLSLVIEGAQDEGIKIGAAAHDEVAFGVVHRMAVMLIKGATVGEQQIAGEIGRRGQELPLGITIRTQHHAVQRLGQQIHIHMQFHRGGADRGEATGEVFGQSIFQGEGSPILEADVLEAREGTGRGKAQHLHRQFIHQPGEQQSHEGGELSFGELIMKGLILNRLRAARVEGALNIGNRVKVRLRKRLDQTQGEAMGRDDTFTTAEPRALAKLIEGRFIERALKLVDHRARVDLFHLSSPAYHRNYGSEIRSTKINKVH